MSITIRGKIILISLFGLLITIGINTVVISLMFNSKYADVCRAESFVVGGVLVSQLDRILRLRIPVDQILGFDEQCRELVKKYDYLSYAMVVDPKGQVLFHSDATKHGSMLVNKAVLDAIADRSQTWRFTTIDNSEYYDLFIPLFGGHQEHVATVRIGFPVRFIRDETSKVVLVYSGTTLSFLVIGLLVIIGALTIWVFRPLKALMDVIEHIKDRGTTQNIRLPITSNDEIGKLADMFNKMAARLSMDMARRKRVERELKNAKDVAEMANYAKTEFLANMSHELRTPMHHILNYSAFGQKKAYSLPREKLFYYFSQIRKTGDRLMFLLNDLLDLSKFESGKTIFYRNKEDMTEILDDIISEASIAVIEEQISIKYEKPEFSTSINCDGLKISQVVRNLLANAIKYAPENTEIEIAIEKTEIEADSGPVDALQLSIKDEGLGIPESELSSIFGKFIQSTRTKTSAGGTGLGLAICNEIIKAHHGEIWAENNMGAGARFIFKLPYGLE